MIWLKLWCPWYFFYLLKWFLGHILRHPGSILTIRVHPAWGPKKMRHILLLWVIEQQCISSSYFLDKYNKHTSASFLQKLMALTWYIWDPSPEKKRNSLNISSFRDQFYTYHSNQINNDFLSIISLYSAFYLSVHHIICSVKCYHI